MQTRNPYPDFLNADLTISPRKVRIAALTRAKIERDREICRLAGVLPPAQIALSRVAGWYADHARKIDRSKLKLRSFRSILDGELAKARRDAEGAHYVAVERPAYQASLSDTERRARHHDLRADLLDSQIPPRHDEAKAERAIAAQIRNSADGGMTPRPSIARSRRAEDAASHLSVVQS